VRNISTFGKTGPPNLKIDSIEAAHLVTPLLAVTAMRAFHSEASAIKRDKIAGDAAHLLKPYLPPRDRKLRLPDIYEMSEDPHARSERASFQPGETEMRAFNQLIAFATLSIVASFARADDILIPLNTIRRLSGAKRTLRQPAGLCVHGLSDRPCRFSQPSM
jgi:hypothetical protein